MYGEPKNVKGECNARLLIGDNFGDGHCTMRCHLSPGHEGSHRESYGANGGTVTVTWDKSEEDFNKFMEDQREKDKVYGTCEKRGCFKPAKWDVCAADGRGVLRCGRHKADKNLTLKMRPFPDKKVPDREARAGKVTDRV